MDPLPLTIPAGDVALQALHLQASQPRGLVVFVHGTGSNRLSPRNLTVARVLQRAGLVSLLFDLLTPAEQRLQQADPRQPFRLAPLVERLQACLEGLAAMSRFAPLFPVGLFGASSGAAVALQLAAERPAVVSALVSRGGRPDLAAEALERVRAPSLLIVGGHDQAVLALNRQAALRLCCPHRLEVVPGAGHLFAEPGCLDHVAWLARDWFLSQGAVGGSGR